MDKLKVVSESIDRLVSLVPGNPLGPGVLNKLYDASWARHDEPLSYCAAKGIVDNVGPGDVVFIATGIPIPPSYFGIGETDGLPGAVILARALSIELRAIPI